MISLSTRIAGVATPVLTFVGTLIVQATTRISATELEIRSRREETMRNLRSAGELAVAGDEARARPGILSSGPSATRRC